MSVGEWGVGSPGSQCDPSHPGESSTYPDLLPAILLGVSRVLRVFVLVGVLVGQVVVSVHEGQELLDVRLSPQPVSTVHDPREERGSVRE